MNIEELKKLMGATNTEPEQRPTQPKREICGQCKASCKVWVVKKEGKNQGREFYKCKVCGLFEFVDMPKCEGCNRRLYEAISKRNGRSFSACPNQCKGQFRYTD